MNQRRQNSQTPDFARSQHLDASARAAFNVQRSDESLTDFYQRLGERSDREDLVMFINACFAATRQNEFYTDRFEQTVSIEFLHRYVMTNYRRIYARSLAAGINHFNQAEIILNLLQSGAPDDPEQRNEEGKLIQSALRTLPPNRVFRIFKSLQTRRINNRRSRAVVKRYLEWRVKPEFDAVKYGRKLRAAATHCHLKLEGELGPFLFKFKKTKSFQSDLFDRYKKAYYSESVIYELPFTVAESLATRHQVPRDVFLRKIEHKMTAAEKFRYQTAASKVKGAQIDFDLGRASLTRLAIYVLSLPVEQRAERVRELAQAFEKSVMSTLRSSPLHLGRVAAVLDRSRSSEGSRQKRNRPLAVAVAINELLKQASDQYKAFWTEPIQGEPDFMVTPQGQTAIADRIIDALQWQPDLLLIVSDGYENDPPGAADQVLRIFSQRIANQGRPTQPDRSPTQAPRIVCPEVVHLNPVFDSDHYAPKPFGETIATVGIRDARDLATMLGFSRFASGMAKLDVLENHLEQLAGKLIDKVAGDSKLEALNE